MSALTDPDFFSDKKLTTRHDIFCAKHHGWFGLLSREGVETLMDIIVPRRSRGEHCASTTLEQAVESGQRWCRLTLVEQLPVDLQNRLTLLHTNSAFSQNPSKAFH